MREHSKTAWGIASAYANILASETRDLAAMIDSALMAEREACAKVADRMTDDEVRKALGANAVIAACRPEAGIMDPEVYKYALRVAHLGTILEPDERVPAMLKRETDRLYDALTAFAGGEEPDLTFCCGCTEEIELDHQEQWVSNEGKKYHERCFPKS